jgi:hypothetical protein
MRQETWEQLSNREISYIGSEALAANQRSWYHGETEDFIIHYRNFSDALQIAREIEFDLWYVAKSLGARKEQYARKSHVYVFQDDKEWQAFVKQAQHQEAWAHSFAVRDELFLTFTARAEVLSRIPSRTRPPTRLFRGSMGTGNGHSG